MHNINENRGIRNAFLLMTSALLYSSFITQDKVMKLAEVAEGTKDKEADVLIYRAPAGAVPRLHCENRFAGYLRVIRELESSQLSRGW